MAIVSKGNMMAVQKEHVIADIVKKYQDAFVRWAKARDVMVQETWKAKSRISIADLYQVIYPDIKACVEHWLKRRVGPSQGDAAESPLVDEAIDVYVMSAFHAIVPALAILETNGQTDVLTELLALVEQSLYNGLL